MQIDNNNATFGRFHLFIFFETHFLFSYKLLVFIYVLAGPMEISLSNSATFHLTPLPP